MGVAAVQFRVLGAVEALLAHQRVNLGHTRQRCVLAVLLVEANRVVSVSQLMDRVWDEHPPQRGREVLYSYLSRLRTALAVDDTVTIQRLPAGYTLLVEEESVDLHRFRSLTIEARQTHDDAHALALFDQALQLWHGTPFTDLDSPWLASIRVALEAEREAAELDRTDAALRCGRHAQLLADLGTRAAQRPFDERIAGQLMLALAGTGRQADALTAYQHTRQALIDHLGLEPGPDLRHLHECILAGNAESVPPARTQPAPPDERLNVVVPRQLPVATRHFTGRQAELGTLAGLLASAEAASGTVVISAIDGMAGIGKTALAVHAAHRLADQFPDGVLFTDLHGFTPDTEPTAPEQALDRLLRGLGVPGPQIPPDLEARVGLYRSVLARRRVLIVLDNAVDEAQLTPLLPASAGCAAIVTSRRHLAGLDDATHLTLTVLDPTAAATLFRSLLGNRAAPADQAAIERIVTLCGRLPLAIRITAARLRLVPAATPATLCAELEHALEVGRGLDWLSDGHRAVTAALAVSVRHLTPDQQRTLRLAGLHPGPDLEPYAMAALTDTTLDQAGQLLEDLHIASLLDQPTHRRYTLHDLVAAYARQLAAQLPEPDRHTALDRLYDHYAATSARAMDLTYPWEADHRPLPPAATTCTPSLPDRDLAQAWLDTETDNLLAAAHHAANGQRADHTLRQSTTLHWHLRGRGHYAQAIRLHERARQHAYATADPTAELDALNSLGHIHRLPGRYEPATDCFEQALVLARQTGHRTGEQDALHGLGHVHYRQGRYGPATDCFEQALALARQTGHRTGEQDALHGLGHVHYAQGRYGPATDCFEQALALTRQTGHRTGEQDALRGLGNVHYLQGRYGPAIDCFEQALVLTRQTGHRYGELFALRGLGDVHYLQGRYGPAIDCFEQALALARLTGNRYGELFALIGVGQVHYAQGRYGPATECCEQALGLAGESGDRNGQFEAHQSLGRVHHATHNHRDALRHHQAALHLALNLDQPPDQARAHDGLAHAYLALGNPGQARHHWQAALHLLTSIGSDHTEDVTTAAIRTHLQNLDNPSTSGWR